MDCLICGAKATSRKTKTPRWRCSPAPGNGGCGYEFSDGEAEFDKIDRERREMDAYVAQNPEIFGRVPPPPPPAAPVPAPDPVPVPSPRTDGIGDGVSGWILSVGGFALFVVILIWFLATFVGFGGSGDGYKETCAMEDRGGRIREVCW